MRVERENTVYLRKSNYTYISYPIRVVKFINFSRFSFFFCILVKLLKKYFTDLATDAFLAAYIKLTARRVGWAKIYFGKATNFKGASASLFDKTSEMLKEVTSTIAIQKTK